jgi:suppressor for copper-sensitivity B
VIGSRAIGAGIIFAWFFWVLVLPVDVSRAAMDEFASDWTHGSPDGTNWGGASMSGTMPGQSPARLRLIAAAPDGGAKAQLGLEVEMQPGWKFYWRNPGEAGLSPTFDWQGSKNLAKANVHYPAPKRIITGGFESFVYADRVILPITAEKIRADRPLDLVLNIDYGICAELCVPQAAELRLTLAAREDDRRPSPHGAEIAKFMAMAPQPASVLGLAFDLALATDAANRPELRITAKLGQKRFQTPDLIVEGPPGFWFSAPSVMVSDHGNIARFIVPVAGADMNLQGQAVRLTLIEKDWSAEADLTLP